MRKTKPVLNWLFFSIFIYISSLIVLQNVKYFDPTLPLSESSSTTASTTSTSTTTASTTITTTKAQLNWEELEDIRLKLVHEIGDSPVKNQSDLEETRQIIIEQNNRFINGEFQGECNTTHYDYLVIVQVHKRIDFLSLLLSSLEKATKLSEIMIVVSVDVFDPELIKTIESELITICHSVVYHPYSMSFWRNQYPAEDPRDCSRDQKTELDKCNSEAKADTYGHYREVKFSQIKLHWTWKLNFITEHFTDYNYILLLEEDYYVSEDIFQLATEHVLPQLKVCEETGICLGALGNYPKTFEKMVTADGLVETRWTSSQHNMGMLISPKWMENLKKHALVFCTHDDYNWDYSLMRVSQNQEWKVIYPKFPRVYHLGGECGYHTKKQTCNTGQVMQRLESAINKRKNLLNPSSMIKSQIKSRFPAKFKGFGGWGDIRDRRLCLHYFSLLETSVGALI